MVPNVLVPCFDLFNLNLEVSNLNISNTPVSFEIKFQQNSNNVVANLNSGAFNISPSSQCISSNVSTVINVDNINSIVTLTFNTILAGTSCSIDGDIAVEFNVNSCTIYNLQQFDLALKVTLQSPNQTLMMEASAPLSVIANGSSITNTANLLLDFKLPTMIFDKVNLVGTFTNKDNEYFTKNEIVDRYYKVYATTGIIDYFTLDMKIEDDVEVILLEAFNPNTVTPIAPAIFNGSIPLAGGSSYKMVFHPLGQYPLLTPLPANTFDLILGNCLVQDGTNPNPASAFLYNDQTNKNYIYIHEKIRLTKIRGCNSFNTSQTKYNLSLFCEKDYTTAPACATSYGELNIQGITYQDNIGISLAKNSSNQYLPLSTGEIDICNNANSTSPSAIDYTVLFTNLSTLVNSTGAIIPNASGTVQLDWIRFSFNKKYFQYTSLYYGTFPIPPNFVTISTTNDIDVITIDVNGLTASIGATDPNLISELLGVEGLLNTLYPTQAQYNFFPPNHRIGITLSGLKFIGCADPTEALEICGKDDFFVTRSAEFGYKNACSIGSNTVISSYSFGAGINNTFDGNASSSALYQDVGTVRSSTPVTTTFQHTSTNLNPWQLNQKNGIIDLLSCPNLKSVVVVKCPNSDYTLGNAIFTDLATGQIYNNIIPSQIGATNNWEFIYPNGCGIDVQVDFVLNKTCTSTSPSGLEYIDIQYRSYCDDGCVDCFITYACTKFGLNVHCFGSCPASTDFLETKNFDMRRNTFGWANYSDWNTWYLGISPTPNTPPSINCENRRYYPCDEVKIISNLGETKQILAATNAIYFDVNFDKNIFPPTYDPLIDPNPFILKNGNFSFSTTGAPCLLSNFPVSVSSIAIIPPGIGTNPSTGIFKLRFYANMATLTGCGASTIEDVLHGQTTTMNFEAIVTIKGDLNVCKFKNDVYEFPIVEGEFTGLNGNDYINSCDPYVQSMKILHPKVVVNDEKLYGAFNYTVLTGDQSKLFYYHNVSLEGGLPLQDDFPNEFRPLVAYPNEISFNKNANINYSDAKYVFDGVTYSFSNTHVGNNYVLNAPPTNFVRAFEKGSTKYYSTILNFNRSCGNLNMLSPALEFNFNGVNHFKIDTAVYARSCITTLPVSNQNYNEPNDDYQVNFSVAPPTGLSTSKNPTDPIIVDLTFNPTNATSWASGLNNCFIYFTGLSANNQNIQVKLVDQNGVERGADILLAPQQIGGFNSRSAVYKIGDLPTKDPQRFYISVSWSGCKNSSTSIGYNDLTFVMNVSHIGDYSKIALPTFPPPLTNCKTSTFNYNLKPRFAGVAINYQDNEIDASGCAPFSLDFNLQSLGTNLNTVALNFDLPNGCVLDIPNCTINGASSGFTQVGTVCTIVIDPALLPSFYQGSINEFITLHLSLIFNGSAPYPSHGAVLPVTVIRFWNSTCGISTNLNDQSFKIIYKNPPTTCTIVGTTQLCPSPGSTGTISTSPAFTSYLWNNNQSTQSITVTTGVYTVTVTDANSCTQRLSHSVGSSFALSLGASPNAIICGSGNNNVTLTAYASPSQGVQYLWNNGLTTSSIVVPITSTTTFTVTATDVNGCVISNAITVYYEPVCCISGTELKQQDFNTPGLIIIPNGYYSLNENIIIPSGTTVEFDNNVSIDIAPNTSITIKNEATFKVEKGLELKACNDKLWHGIIAEPGSTIILKGDQITTRPVLIKNAKTALEAYGSPNLTNTPNIDVDGLVSFEENNIGIFLHDGEFSDAIVRNTEFKCSNPLLYPFSVNFNEYSTNHIKLSNAGTVHLNTQLPDVLNNTFTDAYRAIYCDRTNLSVDNSKFIAGSFVSNPNQITQSGIYATDITVAPSTNENPTVTYPNATRYKINIGNYNAGFNTFLNFDGINKSIEIYKRYQVNIIYNKFYGGNVNIQVGNTGKHFQQAFDNHVILIQNNEFDFFKKRAVLLQNNYNCVIRVTKNKLNQITFFDQVHNTCEALKGIVVDNGFLSASTLEIHENEISWCRRGIFVRNQSTGRITNNKVYFDIPDAELLPNALSIFRHGIEMENTRGMNIQTNDISRMLTGNSVSPAMIFGMNNNNPVDNRSYLAGIKLDDSDANVSDNIVTNIPIGCDIAGNAFNSQITCNIWDKCQRGINLFNAIVPIQGDVDKPTGNQWLDQNPTPTNRIDGTLFTCPTCPPAPPISWYYNASSGEFDVNPSNLSVVYPDPIGYHNCYDNPTSNGTNRIKDIWYLINSSNSNSYTPEANFQMREYAYRLLKDSIQLLYNAGPTNITLQNFFNLTALSSVSALYNVEQYFNDDQLAEAAIYNSGLQSSELIEYNNIVVNAIYSSNYDSDTIRYDAGQRQQLFAIAYQSPNLGGEAVYRARAILNLDIDDTHFAYRLANADSSTIRELFIYPNPSTGKFTINYNFEKEEIVNLTVFNLVGESVGKYNFKSEDKLNSFDLTHLSSGVYTIKSESTSKPISVNRIIILK